MKKKIDSYELLLEKIENGGQSVQLSYVISCIDCPGFIKNGSIVMDENDKKVKALMALSEALIKKEENIS